MKSEYFYLAVRIITVAYILYRLWRWLFCGPAMNLWNKIPTRQPAQKPRPQAHNRKEVSVVGRTKTVYLEDPKKVRVAPVASENLEPTGFIGQDDEISPDDVETDYQPPSVSRPPDDELYDDETEGSPSDPDLSTGMTFEWISEAVSVLTEPCNDEEKKSRAAKTLDDLRNTQIFECITREVCNLPTIEKLMEDYLDANGDPRRLNMNLENFSIGNYI